MYGSCSTASSQVQSRTCTSRPRIARPRTAASTVGGTQQIICAVTESRGVSTTVGLCFVNLSTGECVLSEICDSQTYVRTMQKLAVFEPLEILIPSTAVTPRKSILLSIMEDYVARPRITRVPRSYFNEQMGHDYLQELAFPEDLAAIKVAVHAKYYAISAAAAAMKHIELTYMRFALNTLRIKYQGSEGSLFIDFPTVQSLELIQNLQNPKSTHSLFGLLNNTQSAMGARLLRSNVLQPLTDVKTLNSRLDVVEEFTQREPMFFQIRDALKDFPDMDRLLTALITVPIKASLKYSEQSINNVILLKQAMSMVPQVHEALVPARAELLVTIRNLCHRDRTESVAALINNCINKDVQVSKSPLDLRNQRCYAIKSGMNGLLDVARQTYKEATEDVHALVEELSKEYELPLDLRFESSQGYYLRLSPVEFEDRELPTIFVNVIKGRKFIDLTTLELKKRNAKLNDSLTEVLLMSDKTVQKLLEDVGKEVPALFQISESIAMLDMLISFAHLCTIQDYVRPEFTDTFAVKAGRHPIREKINTERFVPNDVYASQQSRFQIVTGCNNSGKSTYIRMLALLTIMAQIGSFIPAQYASLPIALQLFARVSVDDVIEANLSTFAAEMRETAYILRNSEKGTLVIMDELGRGTSTRDGVAIALAVCECLIESRAMIWFATHFQELSEILAERAGAVNLHMQVDISSSDKMTMLYKIADGSNKDEQYGIAMARVVGLPRTLVEEASEVSNSLLLRQKAIQKETSSYIVAKKRKLVLKLRETLLQARDGDMGEDALKSWLVKIQNEFINRMAALEENHSDCINGVRGAE